MKNPFIEVRIVFLNIEGKKIFLSNPSESYYDDPIESDWSPFF